MTAPPAKAKAAEKKAKTAAPRGVKRASPAAKSKPQKRRKVSVESDEEDMVSEAGSGSDFEAETSPPKKRKNARAKVVEEDEEDEEEATPPPKKAAAGRGRGRPAKTKVVEESEEDEEDQETSAHSREVSVSRGKGKNAKSRTVVDSDEENEDATSGAPAKSPLGNDKEDEEDKSPQKPSTTSNGTANDSESELSSVIDEPPPKKKRQPKSASSKPAPKAVKAKGSKAKDDATLDPDEAEIKRLQGWLIKCGIRKLWHRELAPYDAPKQKINHLKRLLKDAGMDGRYSLEKARQIKEQRELAADLEAVQEGAKRWGNTPDEDDEEGGGAGKSRRRLAKGLQELDFLNDDGGDDSD